MSGGKFGNTKFEDADALKRWREPGESSASPGCSLPQVAGAEAECGQGHKWEFVIARYWFEPKCPECGAAPKYMRWGGYKEFGK